MVADHVEDAVGRRPEALRRGRQGQVDAAGDLALGQGDIGGAVAALRSASLPRALQFGARFSGGPGGLSA